nr:MAG TPA: hypothetical protein [Caudoviricetes sp.]
MLTYLFFYNLKIFYYQKIKYRYFQFIYINSIN